MVDNGCVKMLYTVHIFLFIGDERPPFWFKMFVPKDAVDNTSSIMSLLGNGPGTINEIFIYSQFIEIRIVVNSLRPSHAYMRR